MITLLYFARLREVLGTAREQLAWIPEWKDVRSLATHLQTRGNKWGEALAFNQPYRVAVNQQIASPQTPIHDGDEIAFLPPITGG